MAQQVKVGQPVSRRLGDLLVADGQLRQEQLHKAVAEQKGSTEKLGSVLIRLGFITEELREAILRNAPTTELREVAQSQGMKTLRESGLLKVLDGTTTIEEALRVTLS